MKDEYLWKKYNLLEGICKLVDIISQLREDCPWDKEQTHESLSKHLIEEA